MNVDSLLPGPSQAAAFAAAVLVLNATPGVDLLLTVSRTLQAGARAGAATALGIAAGCVLHAMAAAFGLAALLALVPAAFTALQWAGAAWLVWLGLGMLRQAWHRQRGPDGCDVAAGGGQRGAVSFSAVSVSLAAELRAGLLTNLLNPKVALFFLAFLPQFVPADTASRMASFLLLGAWFVAQGTLFLLAVVALSARAAHATAAWGARPALRRVLHGLGGLLFIGLALRLLGARPAAAA